MKFSLKILPFVFVLLAVGCGKRLPPPPDDILKLTPCIVHVTFGCQTIEDVTTLFRPKDTNRQWFAGGTTDARGRAIMKTAGYYDGVVPGEYDVAFRKVDHLLLSPCGMPMRSISAIPEQYTAGRSTQTITVTEGQSVYIFELRGISDAENGLGKWYNASWQICHEMSL